MVCEKQKHQYVCANWLFSCDTRIVNKNKMTMIVNEIEFCFLMVSWWPEIPSRAGDLRPSRACLSMIHVRLGAASLLLQSLLQEELYSDQRGRMLSWYIPVRPNNRPQWSIIIDMSAWKVAISYRSGDHSFLHLGLRDVQLSHRVLDYLLFTFHQLRSTEIRIGSGRDSEGGHVMGIYGPSCWCLDYCTAAFGSRSDKWHCEFSSHIQGQISCDDTELPNCISKLLKFKIGINI